MDLCDNCIRQFERYKIGETVDVRVTVGTYKSGRVVGYNASTDAYDIQMDGGSRKYNIGIKDVRRKIKAEPETDHFKRGKKVLARFPDVPHEWFPGIIAKVNSDGSYAIQYDDGDYSQSVQRDEIQPFTAGDDDDDDDNDDDSY